MRNGCHLAAKFSETSAACHIRRPFSCQTIVVISITLEKCAKSLPNRCHLACTSIKHKNTPVIDEPWMSQEVHFSIPSTLGRRSAPYMDVRRRPSRAATRVCARWRSHPGICGWGLHTCTGSTTTRNRPVLRRPRQMASPGHLGSGHLCLMPYVY